MQFSALDCQSYAGGFALGIVQAGFKLIGKREQPGNFGVPVMEANRHLLGETWEVESCPAGQWSAKPADLVFGNPPCSAFSTMSGNKSQEWRNSVNQCMYDLVNFAARCDPKIVIFESVQGAYLQGRPFMLELRNVLEAGTGHEWTLHHVLHNVSHLGGAQIRKRYFWVASRIPFGVLPVHHDPVTVKARIGDLEQVPTGDFDGHTTMDSPRAVRLGNLAATGEWGEGERSGVAWERRPDIHVDSQDRRIQSGFASIRMVYNEPSRVLVGDSLGKYVHPVLHRTITYREAARLTGFPDDWDVKPYQETDKRSTWFGKGITVEAGRWIATAAHNALAKDPQPYKGDLIGEREYLINAQNLDYLTNNSPLFEMEN